MYESWKCENYTTRKNKEDWNGNREDIIKLKNFGNTFAHPFSVFLDFESTLENQESKLIDNELKKLIQMRNTANQYK